MSKFKAQVHVAGAMVVAMVVAACGNTDEGGASDAPSQRTTFEAMALTAEPPDLVPNDLHGGKALIYNAMMTSIMRLDNEGELHSYLLEDWTISEDAQQVTLTLREDGRWSDGTPITSADVAMSLNYYLDPAVNSGQSGYISGVVGQEEYTGEKDDLIDGISAPDDVTVNIELDAPNPSWLRRLAATNSLVVLPNHVLGDVPHDEYPDNEYFQNFQVTSGPYKFVEWRAGQYVEFERNDDWSHGKAGFERVFLKFVSEDAAIAQLETRELQFIHSVDPAESTRIESLELVETDSAPSIYMLPSWILMHREPLLDPRVRQAMAFAIDRNGICQAALDGNCTVPASNIPLIGQEWAMPQEGIIEYNFDPDRARQLLEDANWDPDTELTFLSWFGQGTPVYRAITIAQDNLAAVGMKWTIENVDIPTMFERLDEDPDSFHGVPTGGFDMTVDPDYATAALSCDARHPNGENLGGYCNEEFDDLLELARNEADMEERSELYREAFSIVNAEVPNIHFYQEDRIVAFDSRLKGAHARGNNADFYWNIGEWYWQE